MSETKNDKKPRYDLEERTMQFARDVWLYVRLLPKDVCSIEDGKQAVRASGSVGANYIEANESLSKKDFAMRIKICRKEAKESRYWMILLETPKRELQKQRKQLMQEATELMHIFGAIVQKT